MSRAIVIQLNAEQIQAVVARASGDALQLDAIETVPIIGTDLATAKKQLAVALDDHHPAKANVLLAVPSSSIKWQYLTLPPCPPDDLPALVKLQLDLDSSREEEAVGYDFLPLAGGADQPQRVLAMVLKVAELARVRNLGRVSGLRVDGVVPLAMGWSEIGEATAGKTQRLHVFVALDQREATIWATSSGELALLRQVQLADDWQSENVAAAMAGQLRRTVLSLAQQGIATEDAAIHVVGENSSELRQLAASLSEHLMSPVQVAQPLDVILPADVQSTSGQLLPMMGLAWRAVRNQPSQLDFLHPRKPPAPRSNRRTMVLGSVAAILLVAVVGWQGYTALYGPLWRTEQLEEEIYAINQELEPLEAEERDAARIRDWLDASPNMLAELADLSKDWRPQPFDASEFSPETDGVLKRVEITNRRIVLTGNVASSAAVQPLENRIRDDAHRVRREQSDPATDGGQYPWQVQLVVDVVDAQGAEAQP